VTRSERVPVSEERATTGAGTCVSESELHYQDLFDHVPVGLYRTTPEGRIVEANPALVQLLGYPDRETMLSANAAELYVDPADRRRALTLLQRDGMLRDFETRLARFDGSSVWVRDNVRAIRDADGRTTSFLGSLEDVSHRRRAAEQLEHSLERLHTAMIGSIEAMAAIAEIRDPYTAGHQRRVAELASAIAEELGLEPESHEGVRLAGLIHDIGKIYVPAEILSKPGRLTAIEFNLIRVHPEIGYEILKRIEFPWPLAQIVRQHHEAIDGSGYPLGLKGDELLIESKILAVADVVEAMASHRPYRPSLGLARALDEIRTHRGTRFEPAVADACFKLFDGGFLFDEPGRGD
jgi:PAS domain S-box-containing protein/putative nucleotidyltransferase with HDIG domain